MASTSAQLRDFLKPLLPDTYKYVTSERATDKLTVPTVFIRARTIEHSEQQPNSHYKRTFVVTVATPEADLDKAEEALEDHVETLLIGLDDHPALIWETATKSLYTDSGLSYDISVTLFTRKA